MKLSSRHLLPCWWLLHSVLVLALVTAYPEYRQELPNIPLVNGRAWPGVGHLVRDGGGERNAFGQDFAAAGYTWDQALCRKDSDGDGFSNGQELGDPDCKWKKGQPPPRSNRMTLSHPGLKQSVPQLLPAKAASAAAGGQAAQPQQSPGAAPAPSGPQANSSQPVDTTRSTAWSEPNADTPEPKGSERNRNGDQPQRWCADRQAGATNGTNGGADSLIGSNSQWLSMPIPDMTVLGTPDMYSCHPVRIPDSVPDEREFVGVKIKLDGASHLHHVLLMECPGDLYFLQDVTRNSEMCTTHSGSMFAACNRWWIATEASNNYQMCTAPGLIYARAGEMRRNNKVLVLQVHWVFGAKLLNESVSLRNASMELLHEDPPTGGHKREIMETLEGTAIYPPSQLQHVNSLIIPGGQESYTASYSCAKRCTYVPLGRLSPKPVTIAGYTFHGHHYMTGMRMHIKRCPLTHLPDVSWEVTDWQKSYVHPTYDVMGQHIQLYPGDELSWSCIYNTSRTSRTVYGGYGGFSEEMCIMLLHYYPRNALLRGCMATTAEQGGHSVCMFEGAQVLNWVSHEADKVPIRTMLDPRTLPPPGQPSGLSTGYKASVVVLWLLVLSGFLWGSSAIMARCRWLGRIHTSFVAASLAVRRNMPVYIMHIVLDTMLLAAWFEPLFGGWCGCTEAATSQVWLTGFILLYIVISYALELVWRARIDAMLALHHVCTIIIISMLLGEAAPYIYQVADAVIVLGVFALLEQPTFVALLLKRVLPVGSVHVERAWWTAVGFWFASKTLSLVLAIWFIVRDWYNMPLWARGTFIAVWALVYAIQIWSGFLQLSILRSVQRDRRERQLLLASAAKELDSCDLEVELGSSGSGSSSKDPAKLPAGMVV